MDFAGMVSLQRFNTKEFVPIVKLIVLYIANCGNSLKMLQYILLLLASYFTHGHVSSQDFIKSLFLWVFSYFMCFD